VRQSGARILLCQGDADDFTGSEAYDAWGEALGKLTVGGDATGEGEGEDEERRHNSNGEGERENEGEDEGWPTEPTSNGLEVVRIPGASHFWGGQARSDLIEAVTQFLT
jgi:hypothetical protein